MKGIVGSIDNNKIFSNRPQAVLKGNWNRSHLLKKCKHFGSLRKNNPNAKWIKREQERPS